MKRMRDDTDPPAFRPTRRMIVWSLIGLACIGTLGAGWVVATDPQHLVIDKVRLQGTFSHVDVDTLKPRIASCVRGNFLTVDMEGLRANLGELPWIKRVEVQRRWPRTLDITIHERDVIAQWGGGALDRDGELFFPDVTSLPAELPVITGPEGLHQTLAKKMLELEGYMKGVDAPIARVDVDARRAYRLTLRNGVQLMLGRRDMEIRLARYARAYTRLTEEQQRHIVRVDLRYNNGFALARADQRAASPKG